jgi:hypothetical protein
MTYLHSEYFKIFMAVCIIHPIQYNLIIELKLFKVFLNI